MIRGSKSSDSDYEAFGIVQVSCGLHVGTFRQSTVRPPFAELNKADASAISDRLRSAFSPDKQFLLEGLGASPEGGRLPHTWLGEWSRHQPVGIPSVFLPSESDGLSRPDDPGFPAALDWPGRKPEPALNSTYVRLQRVVQEASFTDHNDRVVTYQSTQGDLPNAACDQLRNFFAWLFAQRRSAIYASNLSERIYHIWLPGGLLSPADKSPYKVGPFAMLPLITMVRRPTQLSWRHTIGVTVFFVPVQPEEDGRLSPRPLISGDSHEVELLTRSLEGGSSGIRPAGKALLYLEDCPFRHYVTALTDVDRHPSVIPEMRSMIDSWQATPRKWIELCCTLAADGVGKWDADASLYKRRRPDAAASVHKRRLSDAVLRSLRQTAIWSVAVMGKGLDHLEDRDGRLWPVHAGRAGPQALRPQQASPDHWLADFPAWARNVLEMLSAPGTLPNQGDRVDDVSCTDVDFMTWRVPRRRCLVTMMGISNEHFPRSSLLYIFGWIGHMVIAAASTTETMLELGREIALPLPVAELADTAYQFTLELEEMYDLDSTWLIFTRFFRNIRKSLGIDEQYKGVRERVDLLARHAEVNERIRTERETAEVTIIGAILAIVLIALAAFTVPGSTWYSRSSVIAGSVLLVLLFAGYRFMRSKRRQLKKLF